MGCGRGKNNKSKKSKKKKEEERLSSSSESESDSESGSGYYSTSSASDSEPEPSKKSKLDSTFVKKEKKKKKKDVRQKKKDVQNRISKNDYFNKSIEFRLWLVEEKKKYFDQLSSSKSKTYFKRFVKQWNNHRLAKKYYKGIDMADARSSITKYKWKFAENSKSSDSVTPTLAAKAPSAWKSTPPTMTPPQRTFSTFGKAKSDQDEAGMIGPTPVRGPTLQQPLFSTISRSVSIDSITPASRPVQGPMMPPNLSQVEEENLKDAKRRQLRKERKDFKEYHSMVLDEISPKATGHDAKVEKKLGRAHDRRQREESPDLADSSYMGMGDDIQRRLANRQRQRDQKSAKMATKVEEYQAREKAKMSKLLELARANKSKDALW